jgi:hypothetical protein
VSASRLTDIGTGSGERATADAGCGGDLRLPRRLGLNWQCVRSFMHRRHAGLPLHFRCRSRHLTQALEIAGAVSGGTGFTVRGQCLRWPRWLELNKHAVRSVVRLGHTGGPLHLRRRCLHSGAYYRKTVLAHHKWDCFCMRASGKATKASW